MRTSDLRNLLRIVLNRPSSLLFTWGPPVYVIFAIETQSFILLWHFHESSIPICKAGNGEVPRPLSCKYSGIERP
ncbi:MAG TPA: hypothetical protein DD706_07485, partial [Nitrospiraceae bacterium]|nr:hypothetical protein [Nitrospiraceae bacterium]